MKKIKRWDELIKRVGRDKPLKMVEVGVWQGKMCKNLLASMPLLDWSGVDPWLAPEQGSSYALSGAQIAAQRQESFEAAFKKAAEIINSYPGRAKAYRMTSQEAARLFPDNSLDIVFIDGDHSYEGTKKDILLWAPKVKKGGLLCGHDYKNPPAQVHKAVDELIKNIELGEDHTWFSIV